MASEDQKKSPHQQGYQLLTFGILLLIWVVFSGLIDPFHITLGVISCAFVTWISSDLLFENREISIGDRMGQAWRLCSYAVWLLWQIVLSNVHLLKLAFIGPKSLQPQIVKYETKLESDFEKFLLANSITLTPGTITMKILGNQYYIHAVSDFTAKGLDGEMERRIAAIFKTGKKKEASDHG